MSEYIDYRMGDYLGEYILDIRDDDSGLIKEKIVRCRDCRYYTPQDGIIWPECLWFGVAFRDDDDSGFCKWGEPK